MKTKILNSFLIFSLTVITYSCAVSYPKVSNNMNENFVEMFKISNVNESFQIRVDSYGSNNLKYGSEIPIIVSNKSDQEIFFQTYRSTIRLFIVRADNWEEIENSVIYYGDGLILLPKGSQLEDHISISIRPMMRSNMDEPKQKEIMRVVMIGEIISDGQLSGVFTSAYTDVIIGP